MSLTKKIVFILFSVIIWFGIFMWIRIAHLSIWELIKNYNVNFSFKEEKEFLNQNLNILKEKVSTSEDKKLMLENVKENERITDELVGVEKEIRKQMVENVVQITGIDNNDSSIIIYDIILFFIFIMAIGFLYLAVKLNWAFALLLSIGIAWFPYLLLSYNMNSVNVEKVLNYEINNSNEQCISKKSYFEMNKCIEDSQVLYQIKSERDFIRKKMEENKLPFYFFENKNELIKHQTKQIISNQVLNTIQKLENFWTRESKWIFIPSTNGDGSGIYHITI